ncbi:septation protein SepH [Pseudonocardia sp. TRM90224]|uniref:septation protein SepH n=1 Tax=Pseudonocardia sp. TRM90224 TaxID=2812678 RepID=UPI0021020AD1|nr:septation protein SepH [Pseudonocardia sp. TRM90224]
MRALRVVGITEGGGEISVILEDPDRRERFTVPADEQLRAAARGDRTRLGQISIELESQLRPREIQARIRAGASVEQVASMAGVPLQKIERFAYPVLLERSRTAEVAQRAHPMRADGPDSRMLGDVVAHTFGLRGQEYTEAEWDSWKGEDGRWVVALSWRAGRSDNRAHWTFQPGAHGGTVTAVDEHASDLVEGLPARPLRTVGPVIDIARQEEPAPAPEPDAREELRATGSGAAPVVEQARATAPAETARPPRIEQPREAPAEPPPARRAAPPAQRKAEPRTEPRKPARPEARPETRAETRPEPRTETRAEPRKEPRREPAPPPREEPVAEQAPAPEPQDEPAAEQPTEQPETAPAANRRTKKGKPVMPSWDEVLLGVRGQR